MGSVLSQFTEIASWLFLIYGSIICSGYLFTAIYSLKEIRDYKRRNNFEDDIALLQSLNLPAISILAPAFNEGLNIVENVRSLLTINYPSFEIVIINDGSSDNSMELLFAEYELEKKDVLYHNFVKTKDIKGIYKSKNKAFKNLTVVDKENGGKADALNTGINICQNSVICCIDVDCILENDAMLKLIKPFLNNGNKVIASGGVIRVANSCVIEDGRIIEVKLPDSFVARVQVLEYFRAFLMGRMAWSRVDGLLLISGAFGMFDKQIVIEAGGYDTNTVGEDMELLVRMRRMMQERNVPYTVGFVPDPLCWTEVPQTWEILKRQRNRWTRGTAETLWIHKKMMFNPKYKILGMLSTPFWFFFEWLAPLIEFTGILFFIILFILGQVSWQIFLTFFLAVYSFAILFSVTALFFEEYSFQQYKKPSYIFRLIGTALLEPIIYHPVIMWSAVMGNLDLLRGKNSWGVMSRAGLSNPGKKQKD
ncbi:glycosyltransferase family 2 protein [Gillisia sp. JM1]|uniref:glycosyltransferase family 2 protein n=1 Tax=Gillisia sp. JM1 TaxID=1283286 RepID=UPI0004103F48|nr:glycosyltransferase [Gillisia sp. JM1]